MAVSLMLPNIPPIFIVNLNFFTSAIARILLKFQDFNFFFNKICAVILNKSDILFGSEFMGYLNFSSCQQQFVF